MKPTEEMIKARTRTPAETYFPEAQTEATAPEATEPQPEAATMEKENKTDAAPEKKKRQSKNRISISTCVERSDYEKLQTYANYKSLFGASRFSIADVINEAIKDYIEKHKTGIEYAEEMKKNHPAEEL